MVIVTLVFRHHFVPLRSHGGHVQFVHGSKVCRIKAWAEHRALDGFIRRFFSAVNG